MTYTNLSLIALGMLGVLLHNLVELNKLNKLTDGNVKISQYLKLEIFSILVSIIMIIVCVIAKQEINQLEQVGKWLGLAFVAIGYMGQSLLIFFIGKANKTIGNDEAK